MYYLYWVIGIWIMLGSWRVNAQTFDALMQKHNMRLFDGEINGTALPFYVHESLDEQRWEQFLTSLKKDHHVIPYDQRFAISYLVVPKSLMGRSDLGKAMVVTFWPGVHFLLISQAQPLFRAVKHLPEEPYRGEVLVGLSQQFQSQQTIHLKINGFYIYQYVGVLHMTPSKCQSELARALKSAQYQNALDKNIEWKFSFNKNFIFKNGAKVLSLYLEKISKYSCRVHIIEENI